MFFMENIEGNMGELIKRARKKRNLTQEELALRVGKKRSYISKLETDYANNIKLQTLREIVEKGFDSKLIIEF